MLLKHTPIPNLLIEKLMQIQSLLLFILTNPKFQPRNKINRIQQNTRNDEGIRRNRANLRELAAHLDADAIERAFVLRGAIERGHPLLREDAGEEGPGHAADAVELEHVHALVDADPLVDVLDGGADGAGQEADEAGEPDGDETRGGRDADEAGDGAGAGADQAEAAARADEVDEDVAEDAEAGGCVGVEDGHGGADRGVERGPAVEAEPAEPDEAGADEDEGCVVRFVVDAVVFLVALAEDEGVCEGGPGGWLVDGCWGWGKGGR